MTQPSLTQYGTIPWRPANGEVELLLITSRETQRWVVPRGNAIPGLDPHESAAQETYEEAGVRGPVEPDVIGTYRYAKRKAGLVVPAEVHLFRLEVEEELEEWPERHQRQRRWFAPENAAEAVAEEELKALLLAMAGKTR